MQARKKRKFRRIFLFLGVALVAGGGFYFQSAKEKDVTLPANLQATTPEARDTLRKKYMTSLASALKQSYSTYGRYPFVVPKKETPICSGASVKCKQVRFLDANILVSDGLIPAIPTDPSGGKGQYNSGFSIRQNADGTISIIAPRTEGSEVLSVTL